MRRSLLLASMLMALVAVPVAATATTDGGSPAPTAPPTHVITIRPVTATGHAAPGFRVKAQRHGPIDCSFASPSPGAVDRNIEECSPSAAGAIACWKSALAHHALCFRDPTSKRLDRFRLSGRFARTAAAKPTLRAPLLIVLADGTRCAIRDGGAWGSLPHHPKWFGTYQCARHGAVWANAKMSHEGVNESAPRWTVHTSQFGGSGKLTVRRVKRAYFVSTAA